MLIPTLAWLRSLPAPQRAEWIQSLTSDDAEWLLTAWAFNARPEQLSPWSPARGRAARVDAVRLYDCWVFRAGRGAGKTRSAAQTVHEEAMELGDVGRIALVARTAADARDTMVELGDSSLLGCAPPDFRPFYEASKRRLTWPNGCVATVFNSSEPDQLRGPQHHLGWGDEVASWIDQRTWEMMQLGMRLGPYPRTVVTTTPKVSSKLIKRLESDPRTFVTRGSTYDNAANLPAAFLDKVRAKYEGTSLGRQELHGEDIGEVGGAAYTRELIAKMRIDQHPRLRTVGVYVDPSVTAGEEADATGLLAVGIDYAGAVYVLADYSGAMGPARWVERACEAYWTHAATEMVLEGNQGAELLLMAVANQDSRCASRRVHVTGSKMERAQSGVALAEQGRLRLVGSMPELEDELCTWTPEASWSPGRLDALSLAVGELVENDLPLPAPMGTALHRGGEAWEMRR